MFEASNLHKRFGDHVVLEDVSMRFPSGRLTGIMGPNGAGKTTCFNLLTGRYAPDLGSVSFEDRDITGLPPRRIARMGISRSFQVMNLFDDYSALDNVLVATPEVRNRGFSMLGSFEGSTDILERVGLSAKGQIKAKDLSYGDRRALEIGVALAARPRLLFLDEPTAGLGTEATARIAALIAELKRSLTIVMIEHDMRFLFGLADHIYVMHWGQVIAEGTPGEVVALLGPNGAGKTTTLRSVLGLSDVRKGLIRFDNADITRAPTHDIARRGIGWVPDDRRIFPTLTVQRNLSIAKKRSRFRAWSERECFGIFSELEYLLHRECENLSGGEMQMVAISRALLGSPGLVLLDEPSQGLAPRVVQQVLEVIGKLRREGVAVLLVEQNPLAAISVSDRVYVMDKGRIVHEGKAGVLKEDSSLRARLLGV